jgi:hypothetical protein
MFVAWQIVHGLTSVTQYLLSFLYSVRYAYLETRSTYDALD